MNITDPINILIPDGERVLAKFVVNCLSSCKEVNIHVLSSDARASIKYSRFISSYTFTGKHELPEKRINFIKNQVEIRGIKVIMPVEIEDIQLLSEYFDEFKDLTTLLVPPLSSFDKTLDKWEFYNFLKKYDLPTPLSFDSMVSLAKVQKYINFPLLLKPKIGMGGFGIKLVPNMNALRVEFEMNKDYMIQEIIEGYDIDMSVLCINGKIMAYTIQKGYVFSSAKYSAALSVKFLYEEDVYRTVTLMMGHLKWSGYAHVDLRYDSKDGKFKILEINPRAWGSIEASKSVGINFPYLYILSCLGISYDKRNYSFDTCSGNKGLVRILKSKLIGGKKGFSFPKHKYQLKHFTDPLPLIKNYLNSKRKN